MRIVIFTSNGPRHRWLANELATASDDTMVVAECRPSDEDAGHPSPAVNDHFNERRQTEVRVFGDAPFAPPTCPILYGEVNLSAIFELVQEFEPDAMFVFGASIISEPLVSYLPGRFVNLHLGLSPYYRGSGTNFWPFVNDELEYVGATIHHIDPGVDTGDIISHVRPRIEASDDVHTAGCKVISASAVGLREVLTHLRAGNELPRVPQWSPKSTRYYRSRDFDEHALSRYKANLAQGLVRQFAAQPREPKRLVSLRHP